MDQRRWDQCVTPKTGVGLRRRRRRRKRSGDGDGDGSAVCGYRRHSELWRRAPITVAFAFSLLVA